MFPSKLGARWMTKTAQSLSRLAANTHMARSQWRVTSTSHESRAVTEPTAPSAQKGDHPQKVRSDSGLQTDQEKERQSPQDIGFTCCKNGDTFADQLLNLSPLQEQFNRFLVSHPRWHKKVETSPQSSTRAFSVVRHDSISISIKK